MVPHAWTQRLPGDSWSDHATSKAEAGLDLCCGAIVFPDPAETPWTSHPSGPHRHLQLQLHGAGTAAEEPRCSHRGM